jgi:hypothetical protein
MIEIFVKRDNGSKFVKLETNIIYCRILVMGHAGKNSKLSSEELNNRDIQKITW